MLFDRMVSRFRLSLGRFEVILLLGAVIDQLRSIRAKFNWAQQKSGFRSVRSDHI